MPLALQVSCPGLVPSQLLVPPSPLLAAQGKKLRNGTTLSSVQHCSASAEPPLCHQHWFSEAKTHRTQGSKSALSQLKPGQYPAMFHTAYIRLRSHCFPCSLINHHLLSCVSVHIHTQHFRGPLVIPVKCWWSSLSPWLWAPSAAQGALGGCDSWCSPGVGAGSGAVQHLHQRPEQRDGVHPQQVCRWHKAGRSG